MTSNPGMHCLTLNSSKMPRRLDMEWKVCWRTGAAQVAVIALTLVTEGVSSFAPFSSPLRSTSGTLIHLVGSPFSI